MDSKLLEKFFRKECTPEEVGQVLEWFQRQGVAPWQEDALRCFWEEAEREKYEKQFAHDPKEMLGYIHQQMEDTYALPPDIGRRKYFVKLSDSWVYALRVAAILFIPFLFTWLFLNVFSSEEHIKPLSMVTVETPAGVKQTKVLPDGSTVILNARSVLTFPAEFSEDKREIGLTGEAFFDVAKDSLRPFTVYTGDVSTTALGTSFNINYRPERDVARVSLATGVVQIVMKNKNGDVKATKLQPGEQLDYDPQVNAFHTSTFDTLETLAWKEGLLYFKKADIEQIVQKLEDWYGVEIALTGNTGKVKSQDWTYTGTFKNQSLENVLIGIGYVKDFSYEIDKKDVKLIFN